MLDSVEDSQDSRDDGDEDNDFSTII